MNVSQKSTVCPDRWRRRTRRTGQGLIVAFALIGVVAAWNVFAGAPGVGHFRSAAGREDYVAAYREAMDLMPEPSAVHDVPASHGTVRVYEWATPANQDETPVLLMPGRASGVPMWAENLEAFAGERRVLAFDALGDSGLSEHAAPFTSFADLAFPVDDVVRELAPEGVHLVGHSFGGAVAATYAHQYPENVHSLTLLEPVFTFAWPAPNMLGWAMVSSLPFLPEAWRETALARIGGVEKEPTAFQDEPMARMIAAATEHYKAALPQPSPLSDVQLTRLDMPVYVAIAADQSFAGGQSAAVRAESLPRATVKTWPNTTHSLPMQAAGELEPELLEFFTAHDRP